MATEISDSLTSEQLADLRVLVQPNLDNIQVQEILMRGIQLLFKQTDEIAQVFLKLQKRNNLLSGYEKECSHLLDTSFLPF